MQNILPYTFFVSDVPLDSSNGEWIIVCSENMFTALTGITDYKIIEVQASTDISGQIPFPEAVLFLLSGNGAEKYAVHFPLPSNPAHKASRGLIHGQVMC